MCKKIIYSLSAVFLILIAYPMVYISGLQGSNSTYLQHMEYSEQFEVSGVIEPESVSSMALAYPAYVKNVYVQKNSYVNKGQLIFTLDKEKMKYALQNSHSPGEGDTNMATLASANVNEEQLQAIPKEIYASEDGILSELNIVDGDLIMSGNPIFSISKSDKNVFKITVSQENYSRINVGDTLRVYPLIAPERTYDAVIIDRYAVIRKENTALGSKTVVDVFAQLTNPDEYITQGVQLIGRLIKEPIKNVDFLPYEFIHQDEVGEYVSILRLGSAKKVYIKTGQEFKEGIEVLTAFSKDTIFLQNDNLKKDKNILIR